MINPQRMRRGVIALSWSVILSVYMSVMATAVPGDRHFYIEIIVKMATILYLPACLLERLQSYRYRWLDRARTKETKLMGHMINRQSQAFRALWGIIALTTDLIALGAQLVVARAIIPNCT